jgi:isoamylase
MFGWTGVEGSSLPLGVTWLETERAYNFALYSKHAEQVTLLIYGADPAQPYFTKPLDHRMHKSGRIWHCRIPEAAIEGARHYAYSIAGPPPTDRFAWHHFDTQKVLLDPHAKAVYFPPAFDRGAAIRPGDNGGRAPLGVMASDACPFDWSGDRQPRHESDAIIYELHVKGFTYHPSSGVAAPARGTYAGIVEKIPYLQALGVTVIELLPVFQHDPGAGDYWGYMPLSFFAPHHAYATMPAACTQREEFRRMVKALHQAGLEVILDVVYNHTAEGNQAGPVYSYKGIDNSTYYVMSGRRDDPYENFSGTGNTLHCANRYVREMIVDSLRYWAEEMHVDGFRFDLASIFTRSSDGSIDWNDPPAVSAISADPHIARLRLIAEPWDAAGANQLGRDFPAINWFQWNGRFHDDVRRFVRGDAGMVPALMQRLYGSDDLFPDDRMHAYHPYQSVNYLTSHDGFTLYDLVSYHEKRNWANGHGNSDGPAENYSWNCGWEGDADVPADAVALRKRQVKNFCCLLLLSNGTPMLRAGDEFLQTQDGNNNPYNQDNETSWLDWDRTRAHADIVRFFRMMIAFRRAHPSLSRSRFWREDVRWYGVGPVPDLAYHSRSLAVCLHGASQGDTDLYIMINAYWEPLTFVIQEEHRDQWRRVVDTSRDSPHDILEPGDEQSVEASTYAVAARSIVVLMR